MRPPVDYPVKDDTKSGIQKSEDMTYAALLDKHESKEVITESMIQSACLSIETAQQYPNVSKPELQCLAKLTQISAQADGVVPRQHANQSLQESSKIPGAIKLSTVADLNAITVPAAKALSRWIRVIS